MRLDAATLTDNVPLPPGTLTAPVQATPGDPGERVPSWMLISSGRQPSRTTDGAPGPE